MFNYKVNLFSRKEEVNAHGRVVNELSRVNGKAGNDINLSISKKLQDYSFNRLGNNTGAIVVIDIRSGEILSMVSKPTFNSNDFIGEMHPDKWKQIVNNNLNPLLTEQ